jgi:hypothetical protein
MCTCIHIGTHIHTCSIPLPRRHVFHTHKNIPACVHTYMHIYRHTHTHTHTHIHVLYTFHTFIYIYIYNTFIIYIYIYIYIYTCSIPIPYICMYPKPLRAMASPLRIPIVFVYANIHTYIHTYMQSNGVPFTNTYVYIYII